MEKIYRRVAFVRTSPGAMRPLKAPLRHKANPMDFRVRLLVSFGRSSLSKNSRSFFLFMAAICCLLWGRFPSKTPRIFSRSHPEQAQSHHKAKTKRKAHHITMKFAYLLSLIVATASAFTVAPVQQVVCWFEFHDFY